MIETRELQTMREMEQVQDLEKKVWGMNTVVPTHQTLTAIKNGGIIIGAFDENRLIGFSYGFSGFQNGESYLCSHMLGMDETYRSQGIGEILKQKQREIAIKKGYSMMKWTFDPLETRNAYLNLSKLNGICNTYIENCYGEMDDDMNKGLPSDRFEIHWYLKSPHVIEKHMPSIQELVPLNALTWNEKGQPIFIQEAEIELGEPAYTVVVPKDFQSLKAISQALAMDWRLQTRKLFQKLFQAGYTAIQLKKHAAHAEYIFIQNNQLELGGK